jgi:hypothetical protein
MVPPPEPPPELVSLDDATVTGLRQLTRAKGFHLEMDVTYAPFSIAEKERPRFPKLALAVDRNSGFVGGFHLADFTDRDGSVALAVVLRDALMQLGHMPESIRVQRPRVAAMLLNVATELGIAVKCDSELNALNFARESLEQRFSRGR